MAPNPRDWWPPTRLLWDDDRQARTHYGGPSREARAPGSLVTSYTRMKGRACRRPAAVRMVREEVDERARAEKADEDSIDDALR